MSVHDSLARRRQHTRRDAPVGGLHRSLSDRGIVQAALRPFPGGRFQRPAARHRSNAIGIDAVAGGIEKSRLAATVRVTGAEPGLDTLTVNGLGGNDTITVGAGADSLIVVIANP